MQISSLSHLIVVFDDVNNVAAVAAQAAVTAAFNVFNQLRISSMCLMSNVPRYRYCKDNVHFLISYGAPNLID